MRLIQSAAASGQLKMRLSGKLNTSIYAAACCVDSEPAAAPRASDFRLPPGTPMRASLHYGSLGSLHWSGSRARVRRTCTLLPVSCSQAAAAVEDGTQRAAPRDWRQLHDPAKIGGLATSSVAVQDFGGEVSLERYLRLPAAAYTRLAPDMIYPLAGNSFLLKLPRISMFHVWVAPEVEVHIEAGGEGPEPRLVLEARSCRLPGSTFFQTLEGRFALEFRTELAWRRDEGSKSGAPGECGSNGGDMPIASSSGSSDGGSNSCSSSGKICGSLNVDVWSEVPPPFHLVPRGAMIATCNAVLGGVTAALLPRLMEQLAADYERWASDPAYREFAGGEPQAEAAAAPHQ